MYFLVNASPPKLLNVATVHVHMSDDVDGTGLYFCVGQGQICVFL